MDIPAYLQQTDAPSFPKILWNRPMSRGAGGRLLIVGGQPGHISTTQNLFQLSLAAGLGECRIVLPDSLARIVGPHAPANFVPSNPTGSLGRIALGEILQVAQDVDAIVLAPEVGNNSETAILIEQIATKTTARQILYGDGVSILGLANADLLTASGRLVVLTVTEMYRLAARLELGVKHTAGADFRNQLTTLEALGGLGGADYAIIGTDLLIASEGKLSRTPLGPIRNSLLWETVTATVMTFWTQNPSKPFEALTTGAFVATQTLHCLNPTMPPTLADITKQLETALASH